VRVTTTGTVNGVRSLAFQAKDGGMVAEVMNSRKQAATLQLKWGDRAVSLNLPTLSITTCLWK
jgi:O-glycosyl hydrolase